MRKKKYGYDYFCTFLLHLRLIFFFFFLFPGSVFIPLDWSVSSYTSKFKNYKNTFLKGTKRAWIFLLSAYLKKSQIVFFILKNVLLEKWLRLLKFSVHYCRVKCTYTKNFWALFSFGYIIFRDFFRAKGFRNKVFRQMLGNLTTESHLLT